MNRFELKITWRVVGIHFAVVGLLLIQSLLHGCFRPKPKPEMVTFVDMVNPAPPVQVQEVQHISNPEPKPEPPQDNTPAPEPPKVNIPEPKPIKKTVQPVKKPVKLPVVKPKPKPKPKPKWKPVSAEQIKKNLGKRVKPKPVKPAISKSEISKALSNIVHAPSASGNPSEFSAYDSRIYAIFYGAWNQPASNAARPAKVRISMLSNGRITSRTLIQKSGDDAFDRTVMDAVNSVSELPRPPSGYPLDNIIVQFTVVN